MYRMVEIAGEPRSLAEMDFVAGMRPCEACGDWRPVAWRTGGTGATWIVRGTCPRCANERAYAFASARDLVEVEPAFPELGGDVPSAVVEPYDLLREIDRLVPAIVTEPTLLTGDAWHANEQVVDRVRTALVELAKFLAPGAAGITTERSAPARRDRTSRPERYTRAWIRSERAYWDVIAARIAADAPRIFAADRRLARFTSPRGRLTTDSLAAHRVWLETAGASGTRLDVVTSDAADVNVRGARLDGCRLEGLRLAGADLVGTTFADAGLVEVDFAKTRAETAAFTGAQLTACTFAGAAAENSLFAGARVRGCVFDAALFAWSRWERATIEGSQFHATILDEARLPLAHLVDCDLRGASLTNATLAGAVLERCDLRGVDLEGADLRGATLVACAVGGMTGIPAATSGWVVRDADFSATRDGTDLGDGDDLLEELRA